MKEGYDKMTYKNGDIYKGNWINDLKEEKGKMIIKMEIYIQEIGKII